jgi:hypothetical protein
VPELIAAISPEEWAQRADTEKGGYSNIAQKCLPKHYLGSPGYIHWLLKTHEIVSERKFRHSVFCVDLIFHTLKN